MSSSYRQLKLLYKNTQGEWEDTGENGEFLPTFYTLESNPVELKVDLNDATVQDLYLSQHTIRWSYGAGQTQTGPEFKMVYNRPGLDEIQVYVAKSDGGVVSRGNNNGIPNPLIVTIKNFLGTNISISPSGGDYEILQEELTQEMINAGVTPDTYTLAHLTAGDVSMPLKITTSHTWQLYSDTDTPNKVTLYSDRAGVRYIYNDAGDIIGEGTETAPLKTTSYDDNKYAQFQKTWRYTSDSAGLTPIDHLYTDTTRLYVRKSPVDGNYEFCSGLVPGSEFVGTSGTSTIYYVDDSPSTIGPDGNKVGYRMLAHLDTENWPDLYSDIIDTKTFNSANDKIETPQLYQATYDKLLVDVTTPTPTKLLFTCNGISGNDFIITPNKFQGTRIPFVMSFATATDSIIKEVDEITPDVLKNTDGYSINNAVFLSKNEPFDAGTASNDTYYLGVSSDTDYQNGDITIGYNDSLANINTYSSIGLYIQSNVPLNKIKIIGYVKTSTYGLITGESDVFTINPSSGKYTFFKNGEYIDYGAIMNSYILQENINQHSRLRLMINSIFGEFQDLPSALGKIIYEKISNFVNNTVDIDTCSVQSLYSLADSVQYEIENYNYSYPGGLKRIVDTMSVGIKRVIGTRDLYDDDFDTQAIYGDDGNISFGRNLGSMIDIETYTVSAGVPIIAKEIYGNNYTKIIPSHIPSPDINNPFFVSTYNIMGLSRYPLMSYDTSWNWGLTFPVDNDFYNYYDFYHYVDNTTYPLSSFDQSSGQVDWENTNKLSRYHLTLQEQAGTYNEWFGRHQKVENMIEFSLRDGLQLLTPPS
jgi:hypothetical protein